MLQELAKSIAHDVLCKDERLRNAGLGSRDSREAGSSPTVREGVEGAAFTPSLTVGLLPRGVPQPCHGCGHQFHRDPSLGAARRRWALSVRMPPACGTPEACVPNVRLMTPSP